MRLKRRVDALEGTAPLPPIKPFLWERGQPLVDALAAAGLSLEDEGLMAIRLVGVAPDGSDVPDPVYERERFEASSAAESSSRAGITRLPDWTGAGC